MILPTNYHNERILHIQILMTALISNVSKILIHTNVPIFRHRFQPPPSPPPIPCHDPSAVFLANLRSGRNTQPKVKAGSQCGVWRRRKQLNGGFRDGETSIVLHPYSDTSNKCHYNKSNNIFIRIQ